ALACASSIDSVEALAPAAHARATMIIKSATRCFIFVSPLQRFRADFTGANAHDLLEIEDEDLSVADLSRVGGLLDGLDGALEEVVADGGLDLHLRQEVDDVLGAAIELGVALLAAEALHFRDGDALHADAGEGLAHLVELERLDDGGDQFHGVLMVGYSKDQKVFCTNATTCVSAIFLPSGFV